MNKFKSEKGVFFAYWKKVALRTIQKYIKRNEKMNAFVSLDFAPSDDFRNLHDVIGKEDQIMRQELLREVFTSIVNNPINGFSEKEKNIIKLYLSDYDMKEIARKTNRSLATVYRIYKRAVKKIGSVMKGLQK